MTIQPYEYSEGALSDNMAGQIALGLLERWRKGKITDDELAYGIAHAMNAAESSTLVGDGHTFEVVIVRPKPVQRIVVRHLNGDEVFTATTVVEE